MYKYILILIIAFLATGCITNKQHSNDIESIKEKHSTKRVYEEISKDAIFEAFKKVFILTGGTQFRIDSYRDSLVASKTKLTHYPFYSHVAEDKWTISIEEKENTSYVTVLGTRVSNFDEENKSYLNKRLNKLLIKRVEFFLGLKSNWSPCLTSFGFDDALCDNLDLKAYITPTKEDVIQNIYINQRVPSKLVIDTNDILKEDISLTLDEQTDDILSEEDNIESENNQTREFDDEILKLDNKVNKNIDKTLDKIENENVQ